MPKTGEAETADKQGSCQPSTTVARTNSEKTDELIRHDRCTTVHEITEALQVSCGSVHGIINDLGSKKNKKCIEGGFYH